MGNSKWTFIIYSFCFVHPQYFQHIVAAVIFRVSIKHSGCTCLIKNNIYSAGLCHLLNSIENLILDGLNKLLALLEKLSFRPEFFILIVVQLFLFRRNFLFTLF